LSWETRHLLKTHGPENRLVGLLFMGSVLASDFILRFEIYTENGNDRDEIWRDFG
jgi:hypothetical protein